jgi:hypothetical protein
MYAGTTHQSGLMAGAARPGACAAPLLPSGIAAPMQEHTWLHVHGSNGKPVSPDFAVFTTDRPSRPFSERFP